MFIGWFLFSSRNVGVAYSLVNDKKKVILRKRGVEKRRFYCYFTHLHSFVNGDGVLKYQINQSKIFLGSSTWLMFPEETLRYFNNFFPWSLEN
jgi:hypothetical protein